MGDFRFKSLERFRVAGTRNETLLSLPLPRTANGMVYRRCPNLECSPGLFLLGDPPDGRIIDERHAHLIRRPPSTPGTTCPYCGQDSPYADFIHPEDIEAVKKQVAWAARKDIEDYIGEALAETARKINRAARPSGLISVRAEFRRGQTPARPFVCREDLLRSLTCDICARPYGVFAIALFCPDCGSRNLSVHFRREVELVHKQIALAETAGEDKELSYRILGNAHEDVLTAFETYLKIVFRFLAKHRVASERRENLCSMQSVGNRFQNIERGRRLFSEMCLDPYQSLDESDLRFLATNIEKRHVIGHNLSLADERYAGNSDRDEPGETVGILADEIKRFAGLCRAVIGGWRRTAQSSFQRLKTAQMLLNQNAVSVEARTAKKDTFGP